MKQLCVHIPFKYDSYFAFRRIFSLFFPLATTAVNKATMRTTSVSREAMTTKRRRDSCHKNIEVSGLSCT